MAGELEGAEGGLFAVATEKRDEFDGVDVAGVPTAVAGVFAAGGTHDMDAVELEPGGTGDVALKLLAAREEEAEQQEAEDWELRFEGHEGVLRVEGFKS